MIFWRRAAGEQQFLADKKGAPKESNDSVLVPSDQDKDAKKPTLGPTLSSSNTLGGASEALVKQPLTYFAPHDYALGTPPAIKDQEQTEELGKVVTGQTSPDGTTGPRFMAMGSRGGVVTGDRAEGKAPAEPIAQQVQQQRAQPQSEPAPQVVN